MKIILIQPAFEDYSSKQPPLGLAYLCAALKKKNAEIMVIDANVERITNEGINQKIRFFEPNIVGFSVTTPLFSSMISIAKKIKEYNEDIVIVAGGPHPSIYPEDVLKTGFVDIVVGGEGDETIGEIYDSIEKGISLDEIKGISYVKGETIVSNPSRPLIENLDNLPFPAWDFFPLEKYRGTVRKTDFNLPVMTSRGCPFNCTFCYKGIYGRTWRPRSPENVLEEIKYLKEKFGIKEFSIVDDNFSLKQERAIKICELLIKEQINLPWCTPNGIRVDNVSKELFSKMKQAGCYRVYMAVECGDQKIIDLMNKGITLEQVKKAFSMAKEANLETSAFFMIGNLGETKETMEKTIKLAKELDPDFVQFTIATPYPGTKMYEEIKKNGRLLISDWKDFSSFSGAIFEYKNLNKKLIDNMHKKAVNSFYLRPRFILKYLRKNMSINGIKNLVRGGLSAFKIIKK